ncbi:MAG: HPP family protein [Nitrolancea sp.]
MTREPPSEIEPGRQFEPGPIGGQLANIVRGLLIRTRFVNLAKRQHSLGVISLFSFVNGCLSIGIMSLAALVSGQPFIFPSLGPTAFLFFYTPLTPPASPRNALIGHFIGVVAGWTSLLVFGLQHVGPAISTGVTGPRVAAAALSLGLTSGFMVLLKAPHPPAGATTLIVSLGILRSFDQMVVLMVAVLLLTIQAFVINRLAGLPYPVWAAPASEPSANQNG